MDTSVMEASLVKAGEFRIGSEDSGIHAVFTPGDSASHAERPLVVLSHGLMMHCCQNPISGISDLLVSAGYDTLRFDFRGSGQSGGDIADMTPLTEVNDLLEVVKHVGDRKVVLCGHSLGGLVSILAALRLPGTQVAGLLLYAPAVNIEMDSKAGRVATVEFDPLNIPDKVEIWGSALSRAYFTTAMGLNIFETISKFNGPVCVLMGERDRIVEMNLADRIQTALPQAEINIIPRGDHMFSRSLRVRATELAVRFLNNL